MSVALVAPSPLRGGGDEEDSDDELLRHEAARQRWRLLADALKKRNSEKPPHESVGDSCMGVSFGLVSCTPSELPGWFHYDSQNCRVLICHVAEAVSPRALAGFNNTGNVRVWSSEEVLAHYCLKQGPALFSGRNVLELGGGMTCLAGLMVGKAASPSKVHLSDGNTAAVANVKRIILRNDFRMDVSCSILRWLEANKWIVSHGTFDLILCADCLFFDDARPALASAISCLLRPGGSALVMAPRRGGTFDLFVQEAASRGLLYTVVRCYDEIVWARHETLLSSYNDGGAFYDEDLHYPLLLILSKPV
jgi:calmodulin-lysine N-methyltransferase